jgi:hypothetical protein
MVLEEIEMIWLVFLIIRSPLMAFGPLMTTAPLTPSPASNTTEPLTVWHRIAASPDDLTV